MKRIRNTGLTTKLIIMIQVQKSCVSLSGLFYNTGDCFWVSPFQINYHEQWRTERLSSSIISMFFDVFQFI